MEQNLFYNLLETLYNLCYFLPTSDFRVSRQPTTPYPIVSLGICFPIRKKKSRSKKLQKTKPQSKYKKASFP